MSDKDESRPPVSEDRRAWEGHTRDWSWQPVIASVGGLVNFTLAVYTVTHLVTRNDAGDLVPSVPHFTAGYLLLAAITLISCAVTAAFIRYKDVGVRWSARLFACGMPAFVVMASLMRGG